MDLQQCYDMLVVPAISKIRRGLDSSRTVVDNVKELPADTLPLVRDRRNVVSGTRAEVANLNTNVSLDIIPQWLRSKTLENQERHLDSVNVKVQALDRELEALIEKENAVRQAKLEAARNEYDINSKPLRELSTVRQALIDQGFEDMWSKAGYAPNMKEYIDVSDYTIDECYELLANAPMPKETQKEYAETPYEYCVNHVPFSVCALLIFIVLALTPIFNVVALGGIVALSVLIVRQIILQQKIIEVFSIISGFDLSAYTKDFEPPEGCQPLTDDEINTLPMFSGFEERYDELQNEADDMPFDEYEALLGEYEFKKRDFEVQLMQDISAIHTSKEELLVLLDELLAECDKLEADIIANFKRIGERRSSTTVFKHNLCLGFHEGEDEIYQAECSNIFVPNSVPEDVKANLAKVFIANLFSNLALGLFNVYVYDPHTYGASVLAIYNDKLYSAITFEQENIDNIMKKVQKASKRMFEISGGMYIDAYNEQAAKLEKVPATYNFVLILSDVEAFTKKDSYVKFAEKAHTSGTYFWVFGDKDIDVSHLLNFKVMNQPYQNIPHPMTLSLEECNRFAREYGDDIENNNKPKGLKWADFIANVCPPEQVWSRNTDNEVKLFPGYVDGDPTKAQYFELGNTGNVHGLAAGATGSGKSVFLNHLITTACMMYSPAELQLWLYDFKGSEFGKYIFPEGTDHMLPHIKTCLCTADGDFAASAFEGLEKEGKRRYAIMQKPEEYLDQIPYFPEGEPVPPATDGGKSWNRYWRKRASETGVDSYLKNIFARILVIVDEFQNIFENAEDDAIEILIKACTWLAKVGRASNINVVFSSQTLTGTLSADVLSQMTLRFALRCNKELSNTLLGTDNSATIKYSFGFLYATATGIDEDNQPFIKTPYLAEYKAGEQLGDVAESIEMFYKKLEEIPFFEPYDVTTYLEVTKHYIEEIDETFDKLRDKLPKQGVFFTGAPMTYTTNKAPNNFILARKNNTHILSCFGDTTDFVLFFKQIMRCIKCNETESTVIINSQVQDMTYLCEAETYVEEKFKYLLDKSINCQVMVNLLSELYEMRRDREGDQCTPVYLILLGWDKGTGMCIDPDIDLRSKFTNLLQVCGEKNIHVIMINQTMTGVSMSIINACKYRLAGHCSEDDSMSILGKRHASKNFESMPRGWVYSMIDGVLVKSKLYISPITREIEADKVFI